MQSIEEKHEQLRWRIEMAERLRALRKAKDYTQEKMASLINLSYHTYIKLENGTSGLTIRNICKICKVLSVSSDMILFGETGIDNINFGEFVKCAKLFSESGLNNIENCILLIKKLRDIDLLDSMTE